MADKVAALLEEIKKMSVLELSELVHAVEEEFGVSAAAAVAVAGPAAAAGGAAEEKSEYPIPAGSSKAKACPATWAACVSLSGTLRSSELMRTET